MNWLRLLEIIEKARRRTGNDVKVDRGWSWACYCVVCCELRGMEHGPYVRHGRAEPTRCADCGGPYHGPICLAEYGGILIDESVAGEKP